MCAYNFPLICLGPIKSMTWIIVFVWPNIIFKPAQVTMGNDGVVKMET